MEGPFGSVRPVRIAGLLEPVNEICTNGVPTACRPSAKKVGLKAIEIGSPFSSTSMVSVACASSPAPASSDTPPSLNSRRSGTVLSVTSATRRTESRKGATSITATVADDSHNHTIANVDSLQTTLDAKYQSGSNVSLGTIASGAITITNATNAGGTARNVYQSTSAPTGGAGAVGDLWVLYS